MTLYQKIRQKLKNIDKFGSPVTFRYRGQSDYGTVTGGVATIILIAILLFLFITQFQYYINGNILATQTRTFNQLNPTSLKLQLNNTFMFAIGISNLYYTLDLNKGRRYFDINMQFYDKLKKNIAKVPITLVPCRKEVFQNYKLQQFFFQSRLQYYLCPTQDQILQIQGKATSFRYKYYMITVSKCTNSSTQQDVNRTCVPENSTYNYDPSYENYYDYIKNYVNPNDLNQFNQKYNYQNETYVNTTYSFTDDGTNNDDTEDDTQAYNNRNVGATIIPTPQKVDYFFNFFFVNTIINNEEKIDYQTKYMDDTHSFSFSLNSGVQAEIQVSNYDINTDNSRLTKVKSLWENKTGAVALTSAKSVSYVVKDDTYIKLLLKRSPISITVERKYKQINEIFSDFGGLLQFFMFIFVFIKWYDQACYEIEVTKRICYLNKNLPFDSTKLHFGNYLLYKFPFWILKKIGKQSWMPWSKKLDQYLQDANRHLDITILFRKVLYSQRLGASVLGQNKQNALYMIEPQIVQQSQLNKAKLQFYENYRNKYFPNGQQYDSNLNLNSKQDKPLSIQGLNQSNKQIISQVQLKDDFITQNKIEQKRKQQTPPSQLQKEDQELFDKMEKEMQTNINQLLDQCKNGDKVSQVLYNMIDVRIKKKFLGNRYVQDFKIEQKQK